MAVEKKRVFIGGLFHGVTEQQVCDRFNKFGQVDSVSVRVKTDETGALFSNHLYNLVSEHMLLKRYSVG